MVEEAGASCATVTSWWLDQALMCRSSCRGFSSEGYIVSCIPKSTSHNGRLQKLLQIASRKLRSLSQVAVRNYVVL
jgi:hypothetical protein